MNAPAMLLAALGIAATAPGSAPDKQANEPPVITLTEKQRMALVDTIAKLNEEVDDAEARALFWYRKAKGCEAKVQI